MGIIKPPLYLKKFLWIICCILFCLSLYSCKNTQSVLNQEYTSAQQGISFHYPSDWEISSQQNQISITSNNSSITFLVYKNLYQNMLDNSSSDRDILDSAWAQSVLFLNEKGEISGLSPAYIIDNQTLQMASEFTCKKNDEEKRGRMETALVGSSIVSGVVMAPDNDFKDTMQLFEQICANIMVIEE